MNKRTCSQCQQPIPAERTARAKFCTLKCSKAAHRTSKKICSEMECGRNVLAKGLCGTHYNRTRPNRHTKKLVECAWCGIEVLKQSGGGRKYGQTCSIKCSKLLQFPYSNLPADHWALWFGKTSEWPRPRRWLAANDLTQCAHCDETFSPRSSQAKYCSKRCMRTWHERKNGARDQADILAEARTCGYCSTAYHHTSPQRSHCSDLCRDMAAAERGAHLHHGWIRSAIRASLYERDNYTCQLCGEGVDMEADMRRDDWAPTLDHIKPRSQGGTHDVDNLRTAHRWCNSVRGDKDPSGMFSEALATA